MSTPKAEVAAMLEALPESSSFEDIQYHLYVLEKVGMRAGTLEANRFAIHAVNQDPCHFSRLKRSGSFFDLLRRDHISGFAGEGSSGQLQQVLDGVESLELRRTKQAQEDGVGFRSLQ